MKSSRKPSKISAHSLVQKVITLKTSVELKLESFIKDPKIEATLEDISSSFKKIEEAKEKGEHLQEFQKCEKTLSSIAEKLQRYQELIPKYEEKLKELLEKRSSLKIPDKGDQNFEEHKKKIEDAITYLETTLKATKEKTDRLSDKIEGLLKWRDNLQAALEQFALLASSKECEKESKKLGERLELVCKSAACLSSKSIPLSEVSRTGVKVFLLNFKESLEKSNELFATAERCLGSLLQEGATIPSAANSSAVFSSVAAPSAEAAAAASASSSASSSVQGAPVVMSLAARAIVAGEGIRPESAEPVRVRPSSNGEPANEPAVLKAENK